MPKMFHEYQHEIKSDYCQNQKAYSLSVISSTLMSQKGDCICMAMGEILNGTRLFGSVYFCQGQMKLSISVGGRIACQSLGFLHFF